MCAAHHLSIDIETYSSVDIGAAGLYKYAQSPDFQVLLLAYSLDGAPVEVLDLTTDPLLPLKLVQALFDPNTVKHAFNAAFEWYGLSRYLQGRMPIPPADWLPQWRCTMLHSLYCGYPASLASTGRALGLPEDKQKMTVGKALIAYFCKPCSPTKANGGRTRNLPAHAPEKWALFKTYNAQDVVTEMEIERRLSGFPVPPTVQIQWVQDQAINVRGVGVDLELVAGAQALDGGGKELGSEEARRLTGLGNPNSPAQLLPWLRSRGVNVDNLRKETVADLLARDNLPDTVRRVLELRQSLSKTSIKKFDALETVAGEDGRARGLLQFYGANRTGRWAGRLVQPQNLPRTYIRFELLPLARDLVKQQNVEALSWVFGSVSDTLSQLIRTAFVPAPGNEFVDADFSAVEARIVAWLAGEEWVLEVFRTHGKIYEATASQMFGIPMECIRKGSPEYSYRQRGKVATLALGYGGGISAMRTMDTAKALADLPDEEIMDMVDRWRATNPAIKSLWYQVEAAAKTAVEQGRRVVLPLPNTQLVFARVCDQRFGLDWLTIALPSGRELFYAKPHATVNRFGKPSLAYYGLNQTTKKWEEVETYGGKLVENITQAVGRDLLAEAIGRLERAGYPVVFHIHDEVVVDTPRCPDTALEDVERIMAEQPPWAAGLPLKADGWHGRFFRKD
jgi:DNA polymerase